MSELTLMVGADRHEAEDVIHLLRQQGISARLGLAEATEFGGSPGAGPATVLVAAADLEAARDVLAGADDDDL